MPCISVVGNNVFARFCTDLSYPDGPQLPQRVDERSLAGKKVTLTDMLGFYLYCNRQELKTIPTYASNASERMENRLQDETRWSSENCQTFASHLLQQGTRSEEVRPVLKGDGTETQGMSPAIYRRSKCRRRAYNTNAFRIFECQESIQF